MTSTNSARWRLRWTLWSVAVVLLLELLERGGDRIFGGGDGEIVTGHASHFVTLLELSILAVAIGVALLGFFPFAPGWRKGVLWVAAAWILFLFASEWTLEDLLDRAAHAARSAPGWLHSYYLDWDRNIIQFDRSCSQYDPDLFYTLAPGECRFANREFDTRVAVNHLGLRDDERSLVAPSVILLGDSYAMGWGVEKEATFADRLEKQTGRLVLDAGISSYGTAREVRLLDRLDLSGLDFLIVQYCSNDYVENERALEHGGALVISSKERFERARERVENRRAPFLRHFPSLVRMLVGHIFEAPPPEPSSAAQEARVFWQVLAAAPLRARQAHLIVFQLGEQGFPDSEFGRAVEELARVDAGNTFEAGVAVLRVPFAQAPPFTFSLDEHLNARGHEALATTLFSLLSATGGGDAVKGRRGHDQDAPDARTTERLHRRDIPESGVTQE